MSSGQMYVILILTGGVGLTILQDIYQEFILSELITDYYTIFTHVINPGK